MLLIIKLVVRTPEYPTYRRGYGSFITGGLTLLKRAAIRFRHTFLGVRNDSLDTAEYDVAGHPGTIVVPSAK
jgi:hypothetical protein